MASTNKNLRYLRNILVDIANITQDVRQFVQQSLQATELDANFEQNLYLKMNDIHNITRLAQSASNEINRLLALNTPYKKDDVLYCKIIDKDDDNYVRVKFIKYSFDCLSALVVELRDNDRLGEQYIVKIADLITQLPQQNNTPMPVVSGN